MKKYAWTFVYPKIMSITEAYATVTVQAASFSDALAEAEKVTKDTSILDGASCSLTFDRWLSERVTAIIKVEVTP